MVTAGVPPRWRAAGQVDARKRILCAKNFHRQIKRTSRPLAFDIFARTRHVIPAERDRFSRALWRLLRAFGKCCGNGPRARRHGGPRSHRRRTDFGRLFLSGARASFAADVHRRGYCPQCRALSANDRSRRRCVAAGPGRGLPRRPVWRGDRPPDRRHEPAWAGRQYRSHDPVTSFVARSQSCEP